MQLKSADQVRIKKTFLQTTTADTWEQSNNTSCWILANLNYWKHEICITMLIAFKPLNCMSLVQIICRSNRKKGKYRVRFVRDWKLQPMDQEWIKAMLYKKLGENYFRNNTPLKVFTSYFRLEKNGLYVSAVS